MKKYLALLIFIAACVLPLAAAVPSERWVAVQKVSVKSGTGWFSSVKTVAVYGDKVEILSSKGKWVQIKLVSKAAMTGWVPASCLTAKKVVASTSSQVSADTHELSLAGKGFSAEVENEYKKSANIDYAAVDDVEKQNVDDKTEKEFITTGGLKEAE